ncbi:NAD-dependent epimerase/dehydratase family protein [Ichthyobacterium seriolicida]|uniref:NAD-dependent epimerase/dehydratase n=1 Tax=Ichthyobacterium seriolicida TaxID=242600 RepID=A0A1J1EAD8_9FLAO|nr:NAD-dependent epimerase/dehydratase family protein [Ichthyobacterium seriolicida]BAV94899.1 NAD-dependent epimerase/dehydratase [Ichthyobacterium seriolicida]
MKNHLISGGCGFVGRNMVKRLYSTTTDRILFVDNLSVGMDPNNWIEESLNREIKNLRTYGQDERLIFIKSDFIDVLRNLTKNPEWISHEYGIDIVEFTDVFHFAAIVGGRATIDGDPMKVALDLSIDAEFFYWITRYKPKRVLYPSSSAAYPISKQTEQNYIQLRETDIDFSNMGQPDMTYGWTKLTGEFLAKIAAEYYGVKIVCIRPFSGYGEDQDYSYPIPSLAKRAALKESPFEVWGTGNQGRDFVHIDDVIDCTLLAMDKISDGRAINIGTGKLTTFREIITIFCEIAGYQTDIKCLLDKPVGVFSRYCSLDYVKKHLNWEPKISLEQGLRRVYQAVHQREYHNV